ncbi:hypothetical protein X798_07165 [Onchocerca flexuosa]|uniref:Uncharacterized protein n=1 Tax=Onchocerca flexuosa TaxID=387005 RepID=A0A238BK81_9BILA|nr:hypothetical protein X798_07165 [Onchocerca flexuosa]
MFPGKCEKKKKEIRKEITSRMNFYRLRNYVALRKENALQSSPEYNLNSKSFETCTESSEKYDKKDEEEEKDIPKSIDFENSRYSVRNHHLVHSDNQLSTLSAIFEQKSSNTSIDNRPILRKHFY